MRSVVIALIGVVLLAGCAPAAAPAPSQAPQTSAPVETNSPASTAATQTPKGPQPASVTITLAKGRGEPNGDRLNLALGQHLVLTIISDRDDEVHVHGVDIEIPVAAGKTVTKDIVMDQVGRFEIESHEPALTLLVVQVQ